ncbi:hypothetical protein [Lentibacter sp. XHP0401]|uniref:hypothetical protein n=1 Tax=Lentibacter sp. XHP0401 TaxID=2984334 RepID=UPI0021E8250C|nr:hypothetical protein [Lentibacter sp. XHP0401]MCV2894350.1 hypothetical protein [Lentibacter sp. XHP0401]
MIKAFSLTCGIATALLASSPAQAEPNVACNYGSQKAWDKISLMYVGPWQITHHAGYVISGPMTMPFPASGDVETMQIEMSPNGGLVGTHPEAQQPVVFSWADEPPWSFEAHATKDGVPAPMLSSSDVETLMGCGVENLARLIGRTQVTIDGVTMDMTLRLMVVGPDQMYGIFYTSTVVKGIPVKSWRAVTLTR